MRSRYFAAVTATLAVAGLAFAQAPEVAPAPPKSQEPPAKLPPPAVAAPAASTTPPAMPMVQGMEMAAEPGTACFSGAPLGEFSLFTAEAEYLLWFFPRNGQETLIASNTGNQNIVGPTLIAADDGRLYQRPYSGASLKFGYWWAEPNRFTPQSELRTRGVETRLFALGEQSLGVANRASPNIIRPFFDINNRADNAVIVALPGLNTGGIAAQGRFNLWGAEANAWQNLYYNGPFTTYGISIMGGFRFMDADPSINIQSVSVYEQNLAAFPAFAQFAGNRIDSFEYIGTRNRFYGGQLGVQSRFFLNAFILDTVFKLALGANDQEVNIQGNQIRTLANGTQINSTGSLVALPSNIGRFNKTKFSQIPELDVNIAWPVLNNLTLKLDFTCMYWSKFIRARQQIDRVVDITQIPNFPGAAGATPTGLSAPTVPFQQSDLWILGLGIGAEVKW